MMYGYNAPFYRPNSYTGGLDSPPNAQMQFNAPFLPQQQSNELIFVLNENEAEAYPLAPNTSVFLWDKNGPYLYIKSNRNGVPAFQAFELKDKKRIPEKQENNSEKQYVEIEAFNALKKELETLAEKVNGSEAKKNE